MPARTTPLKRTGTPKRVEAARPIKSPKRRLVRVMDLLDANLGVPVWGGHKNALEVLVLTILSQNTTDPNALRGYQALSTKYPSNQNRNGTLPLGADGEVDKVKIRLSDAANATAPPDWTAVHALTQKQLRDIIRPAGLPDSKARAILSALDWLDRTVGKYDLDLALKQLGEAETVRQISGLKGIGVKTVSVTLIEALGADLCPVDTHVHRLINRLQIVQTGGNRDKTYTLLKDMIPKGRAFALHHNLLTFGRTICTARSPKCSECFLRRLCPSREDR